ncbi:MAG: hypothetical protein MR274_01255 [Clostridium sp.]|nr:hypothetical protein [Clostridium sp.]MDY3827858.1 hypothetical protein [Clostridium sp.]
MKLRFKGNIMMEIIISMFILSIIITVSAKTVLELNKSIKMREDELFIVEVLRAVSYEIQAKNSIEFKDKKICIALDKDIFEELKSTDLIDLNSDVNGGNYIKIEGGENILIILKYNNRVCEKEI